MEKTSTSPTIGRFAPSPTGPLHFGSIVSAVASFLAAKQHCNGHWLVRIDDLDQPRTVKGACDSILRDLESLGLHHDGPLVFQSSRSDRYQRILDQLTKAGHTFPCGCSRKEILASAPHFGEEGPIYPGTCLVTPPTTSDKVAMRLRSQDQRISFTDLIQGVCGQNVGDDVGDFVLQRNDGIFAYQLATIIDDHDSGVNLIVRGQDLLLSTPRQIYLLGLLSWNIPRYAHIPLVMAPDGQKISKRHTPQSPCTIYSPGQILVAVLSFLGLNPPADLGSAEANTVLSWGLEHFSFSKIIKHNHQFTL